MSKKDHPKILVIVGPTGSGKTGLAVKLAKKYSGEVISADSRQIYRGLDIGTEKTTEAEMQGIPHHLIDILDPSETYSAADFKHDAGRLVEEIVERGNLPIIAGGTGFYIDALLGKHELPAVAPNLELRKELERLPTLELASKLEKADPSRYENIDKNNRPRLIRALEIVAAFGRVPKPSPNESPYDTLIIGIQTDPVALRDRIGERARLAVRKGLLDETRRLLDSSIAANRLGKISTEYPAAIAHLNGNLSEVELIQKITEKNWQYAKRQLTWLKRDQNILWFQVGHLNKIFNTVTAFLSK